jgi:hypothetical protein
MPISKAPTIQAIREHSAGNTLHLHYEKQRALSSTLHEARDALFTQKKLIPILRQSIENSSNAIRSYKRSSWQGWVTIALEALPFAQKLLPILEENFSSFQTFNKGLRTREHQLDIDIAAHKRGEISENLLSKDYLAVDRSLTQAKQKIAKAQKEFTVNSSDDLMVEVAGGKEAFEKLPTLDIGERMGSTGYIDFTSPLEMTAPVMRGTDKHGRMFIAIRTKNQHIGEFDKKPHHISILFRRYTNSDKSWSIAKHRLFSGSDKAAQDGWFIDQGRYAPEHILALNTLITTGKCEYTQKTDPLPESKEVVELA